MMPIATHPLFEGVEASIITLCTAKAKPFSLTKGEKLFRVGDPVDALYLLSSGWLKLSRTTKDGEEAILDIVSENTLVGEHLLLQDKPYPYSAEAVEPCRLTRLPAATLRDAFIQSPRLSHNLTQRVSHHHHRLQMEIEHLSVQTAPQRVGCFLLHFTGNATEGEVTFELPYEKSLIATKLGMKPETFSRTLTQLKQQGVEIEGRHVTLKNITTLSDFACAACSSSFPCEE